MSNNNLIKLLYNENIDPLSVEIPPEVKNNKIFNDLIRVVPKVGTKDNAKSILAVYIPSGQNLSENNEYK